MNLASRAILWFFGRHPVFVLTTPMLVIVMLAMVLRAVSDWKRL